jgi:ATP-dependent helicase/nuclease subunit A
MRDEERGVWHWPSRLYCWLQKTLRTDFLAEELRLLYVAMTRARECLALIGTHNSFTKPSNAKDAAADETIPPPEEVHCPLQWLLPVFRWAQSEKVSVLRLQEWPASGERKPPNVPAAHFASASGYEPTSSDKLAATPSRSGEVPTQPESGSESPWGSANTTDRPSWQEWLADLDWQYPYQIVTRWPGKASPTRLRLWLENDEETYPLRVNLLGDSQGLSANAVEGRFSGESWRFRRQAAARPGFLATAPAGPNAAERGRLVHRLLRHLDLRQSVDQEDELRRQLAALVGEKVFTQEEAEVIDVSLLADFFRRPLGDRLRRAQHVQRELPFSLLLPATELAAWLTRHSPGLAPNALDPLAREQVLVQGVMDLLFWEEMRQGPILVDFKTDELSAEELPEAQRRYVPQLALYARAVAEALGQTCREVWLVFLRLRQDILLQQEMLASCLPHSPPSS